MTITITQLPTANLTVIRTHCGHSPEEHPLSSLRLDTIYGNSVKQDWLGDHLDSPEATLAALLEGRTIETQGYEWTLKVAAPKTVRDIEALKVKGEFFAAGALARSLKQPRDYGCHYGFRSDRDHAVAQFHHGWDSPAPTTPEVTAYLQAYYAANYAERHAISIGTVGESAEGPHCVDCTVWVAFGDGKTEDHQWTLWNEGGRTYGEW